VEPAKLRLLIDIGGDAAMLDEDMLDVDFRAVGRRRGSADDAA
jgi:hypothetical protein